ncbi:DAK2 domain-containing protein [uncultured Solobacterium sp.]|jgi:DAK2 domain fusion protein yloV|uniref:DAK2 domain-containing protein n=1 Tax=uncultured Solobacterium sp. TaxID=747375 RepID=UPI001CB0F864|nr:DAK2 domain-containing protein [uncultured Solobacterium sp.]MBF1096040.1 DAK2 domain-containing protein [Solobacterium sp.]
MEKINGLILKNLLESGAHNLSNQRKAVDAMNVFPVPDGDTGTNMSLTILNGISEVTKSGSESLSTVAKIFSRGLLMGARGNSGVILSQIFRGFAQYAKDKEELTVKEFSEALINGSKMAYKAVMRPTEGTILTVVRESSEYGEIFINDHPEASMEEFVNYIVDEANASLQRTPELLDVLKEAHCVDSGAMGYVTILEGFKSYLQGNPITENLAGGNAESEVSEKASGYRVEYIVTLSDNGKKTFKEERVRKQLEQIGNDIQLAVKEDTFALSVHSMTPGEVLMLGQKYGKFTKVQVEDIQSDLQPSLMEAEEAVIENAAYGIIAVAAGEGLKKLFTDYRVNYVVSGGQTMNPSTEDFVTAISKVHADTIYILPNNSNIIMAAKQAAEVTEDKKIIVIETKSVPQGLSACISFNPEEEVDVNTEAMNEAITLVKTGSVTYAVKDTTVDGKQINSGDYMAILEKEIIFNEKDKLAVTKELIKQMCDEDTEVVTLIKGSEATDEECEEVRQFIEQNYNVDIDVEDGQQPVYSFIIGAE